MSKFPISRRRTIKLTGFCLGAPAFLKVTSALAAYPEKPIRIIVPASPGGAADIAARLLTTGMQEILGVSVVIENKPGGGTNIGLGATARAPADGYTIGLSTSAFVINPGLYERLPFDSLKDFAGICEISSAPGVLVVRPDLGVNSIRQFVEMAKKDPKAFNISTPGVGTPPQLQAEVLKQREGLQDMATIVFGGGGDAVTALLSKTVQICSGVLATVHDHVKSGTLRALGISGRQRWHDLPGVPTMAEAGMTDFEFDNYTALLAPINTPVEIVTKLEKAALEVVRRPEITSRLVQTGSEVTALSGKEHMARVAREVPMYQDIIARAGIKRLWALTTGGHSGGPSGTVMIGTSVPRLEDAPMLVGAGRFVDDIAPPGTLHACFLRSVHGHALIKRIDAEAAKAMDGIVAVYNFADIKPFLFEHRLVVALPSKAFRQQVDRPVLAIDEVVYVGEPVAVVIAENRYQAEDALASIDVEYEPLEAVVDCVAAARPGTPTAHRGAPHNIVAELDLAFGNVDEAFARASHVHSDIFRPSRGGSHSIECRGVIAAHDELQDVLTVWSSTQTPHAAMRLIAHMLRREEKSVRVITPDVGGGFGPKLVFYGEELVVALAAVLLKRPVKWIEDRREHFISTTQERDQVWDIEIAVDVQGTILGIRGSMIHDHGAYTARGVNVAFEAMQTLTMPYNVPACALKVTLALTNKVPVTPVRGAGQPQGVFVMERLLDRVASELNLDRADVRSRNLVRPEQMPCPKPFKTRSGVPVIIDSGDLHICQQKALTLAGWADFPKRKIEARSARRHLGIGLANFVELTGRGPFEPATVKITSSGKVHVLSSAAAMGQSTKTMLAQIAAAQLGGDLSNVIVTTGDSATSTIGFGGFGSRQTVTAGSSAHMAAVKVRDKVLAMAGQLLEAEPEDLDISGQYVHLKGATQLRVGLADIAKASLGVAGAYLPGGLAPGMEASEAFVVNEMAYSNGTAVAIVDVDIETGGVAILDFVLAHDCGRVVNPMIVDGQVVGGAVHGIGNALFERMHFDRSGQPLTTTLAEYLLPTSTDVPGVRLVHHCSPSPLNPLGLKGVGESGVLPTAAAIISAVEDALSEFGARISHAPIGPADIIDIVRGHNRTDRP